jgi:hypothetical protein
MSRILVPVSMGELIDKITILELKLRHMTDVLKRENVQNEHDQLIDRWATLPQPEGVTAAVDGLRQVNAALWAVEDDLREKEAAGCFDDSFVQAARSVYKLNDQRAAFKYQINTLMGSELVEEKSYAGAGDG